MQRAKKNFEAQEAAWMAAHKAHTTGSSNGGNAVLAKAFSDARNMTDATSEGIQKQISGLQDLGKGIVEHSAAVQRQKAARVKGAIGGLGNIAAGFLGLSGVASPAVEFLSNLAMDATNYMVGNRDLSVGELSGDIAEVTGDALQAFTNKDTWYGGLLGAFGDAADSYSLYSGVKGVYDALNPETLFSPYRLELYTNK